MINRLTNHGGSSFEVSVTESSFYVQGLAGGVLGGARRIRRRDLRVHPIGLLTNIAGGLNVFDGTAGLMVTIPGLVAAIAAPGIMILVGRLDRRTLVIGLVGLVGLVNFCAALAPNFGVMLAGRVLFGISLGGFWTVAVTLGARLVEKKSMARATTIIFAGVSIATVLGVSVGTFMAGIAG